MDLETMSIADLEIELEKIDRERLAAKQRGAAVGRVLKVKRLARERDLQRSIAADPARARLHQRTSVRA